jgi:single-strand DNA-binding protein
MASVNTVIILGNLGRDPELRHTQNGTAVCSLSVATTRKWRNKQTDEMAEETEWHRVTAWDRSGEACAKYLSKGSQVYVTGRLKTTSYVDKDGVKRYSTDIVADDVQFLGSRDSQGGGDGRSQRGQGQRTPKPDPGAYGQPDKDDDIPF